jgi:hypothetical protein
MSRYSGTPGSSNGDDNDYDDDDDITLKLQEYAALRLTPTGTGQHTHETYGQSFIVNYDEVEIIDGVVFQREDDENVWKIYSAGKFFNLNPEDGLVYERITDDGEYEGQMSAADVIQHPRVAGLSENYGGDDFYYTPVGVVIEEDNDIVVNDDLDVETGDMSIVAGEATMLLNNKTWARTLAKKFTQAGDGIINDNGSDDYDDNPKYGSHNWLTTDSPSLRDDLEGRELEIWVTEQTTTFDDGEEVTYDVPNVQDTKTESFVQIDNDESDETTDAGADSSQEAATDGGTVAAGSEGSSGGDSPETTDGPDGTADGLPDGVPDSLDELLDYMARKAPTDAEMIRNFAEDEVGNPDNVDWDAAAMVANERAE